MKEQYPTRPESRKTISIIVPVYKTERFLSACIASILAQTFTDFELILVDDGSPDGCPALCDAAAAKDSRIRVIHQKNRGLSGARNAGLDAAEGEYLGFVDSDDWVSPHYLEWMTEAMQDSVEARLLVACAHVYYRMESSPYADEALLKELGDEARRMWKLTKRIQKRT